MLGTTATGQPSTSPANPDKLVGRLRACGRRLTPDLRGSIVGLGAAAVPMLLETLQDETLLHAAENEGGWAPLYAAELLAELSAEDSIEPLLAVLAKVDRLDSMRQTVEECLVEFGDAALEPSLRAHASCLDDDYRDSLCTVLAGLGIRDDRVFACLIEQLDRNTELGAMSLADYGDPRAVGHLSRAFDEFEVDLSKGIFANHTTIELKAAIEELGGHLTRAQRWKLRRSQEPADQWRHELTAAIGSRTEVRRRKIGRNEPCWCDSGRKYKKCHLRSDEANYG